MVLIYLEVVTIVIIFSGMIGSGKTTYTQRLADELGTQPFFESVEDNPILDRYYSDPDKYGFMLQIYFLNKRFRAIKDAYADDNNVLDRSIYEDQLFTYVNTLNGNISKEEYAIYVDLLDHMMDEIDALPKNAPDLLIYLDGPFDHILSNIEKRGRDYEQIDGEPERLAYYKQLHTLYGEWFDDYDKSAKLRINASDYDINKDEDWEAVFALIKEKMQALNLRVPSEVD